MSVEVKFLQLEDFDRFREVLRGWDTEPTQLSRGRLSVRWDQIAFDDLVISRLRTNKRIADRTAYEPGHVGFVICLSSKIFCGMKVPAGSLVVFGPGREYRNVLDDNWESFEIGMSSQLFQTMDYAQGVSRRIALGPERCAMPLSPRITASFKEWSTSFLSPFRPRAALAADPYWACAVRERTLSLLHDALHENGSVAVGAGVLKHVQGWGLASRALEFIDRHEHERFSVQRISEEMDCTTRGLQMAFSTTLGVTPLQYLLARRLQLVRRGLLSTWGGAPSVTKAAADQGFVQFGRFSHHYHSLRRTAE